MTGKTISHYRILDKIGEGGMGIVYKAEDTRLSRVVAVKVVSEDRIANPEVRRRFEREAQTISSLNHPNICTLHDVGRDGGDEYLVMEYVEGKPLKGPMPVEEALAIAVQVAAALDHAHKRGIIHRDVKPGNVIVTKQGCKLLDFGIAKLVTAPEAVAVDSSATEEFTKKGAILGTIRFMAPEQWEGKEADARTDIFSFGALIHETITGQKAFSGKSRAAVIGAVMHRDPPPISSLEPTSPAALDHVIKKCLEKDSDRRWDSAADLRDELQWVLEATPSQAFVPVPPVVKRRLRVLRRRVLALSGALILSLAAIGILLLPGLRRPASEAPLRKLALTSPALSGESLQVSPDGRHVAFVAGVPPGLWIQDLDQQQPRRIEGAEGARYPFWSPASDFVAFAQATELKKVSVAGGPVTTVGALPGHSAYRFAGAWSPDGRDIVISSGNPRRLYQLAASGGSAELLTGLSESDQGKAPSFPRFLPNENGRRVLLYLTGAVNEGQIVAEDLETGERQVLADGGPFAWSPSGHVLYQPSEDDSSILFALPFSTETLQPTGEAFPVAQNAAFPSVAVDGTLVYLGVDSPGAEQLVWRDRTGARIGTIGGPHQEIRAPALSPDGVRVVFRARDEANWDIWADEVGTGLRTRLTFDPGSEDRPIWSPDGASVIFNSSRAGGSDLLIKSADGSREAEEFWATELSEYGVDWSRDGTNLACVFLESGGPGDLWYLRRKPGEAGMEAIPFVTTEFDELEPAFSPDGRFLAYSSDESGQYEVYVQTFPQGGGQWQVSAQGGRQPRWRKDGGELFYVEGNEMIAVPIRTTPVVSMGAPVRLFEHPGLGSRRGHQYDVSADGRRFVLVDPVGEAPSPVIRVVQNWYAEFRNRQ